jgi:hypothetical protein
VVEETLSDETEELGSGEPALARSYPHLKALANDYKVKSRDGWTVATIIEPDSPSRPWLPLCIMRRFSNRYRYLVIYVRKQG